MDKINGLNEIAELYKEIDAATHNFRKITGLHCIQFCSKCCNLPSRNIEASILEVLHLALHLMEKYKIEDILEKLRGPIEDSVCILYTEEIQSGSVGRCAAYEFRPLVCRLFGHSAAINKYGDKEILFCSGLKEKNDGRIEKLDSLIKGRGMIPVLSEYAIRSTMIDPVISRERFPLNVAIKKAIEFIGLKGSYS